MVLNNNSIKLSYIIEELAEERGMDRDVLAKAVVEGILTAYQKKYPDMDIDASYTKKDDEVTLTIKKKVVSEVENENTEISIRRARTVNSKVELGEIVEIPFDGKIGRIEIAKAKQVIAQRIKAIESEAVCREFEPRIGTILSGTINKLDPIGVIVSVYDVHALLPRSLSIPGEKYIPGHPIRALLKEVHQVPRGNDAQIILDRASVDFVHKLLELEIPEIFEGLVRIEKIVRVPGYKTKVLVSSRDAYIDPVGTCIGVGGSRIKPILKELGLEKIDIIALTQGIEDQVSRALKPAVVERTEIIHGVAHVSISSENRSAAIGKGGKNIALASQLVGMPIEIVAGSEENSSLNDDEEGKYFV